MTEEEEQVQAEEARAERRELLELLASLRAETAVLVAEAKARREAAELVAIEMLMRRAELVLARAEARDERERLATERRALFKSIGCG
jgi:hypothetical protein